MNTESSDLQAGSALLNYVAALQNKDIVSVTPLIGHHTLVEIPFMRPNRLIGQLEISRAHAEIFEALDNIDFCFGHAAGKRSFCNRRG